MKKIISFITSIFLFPFVALAAVSQTGPTRIEDLYNITKTAMNWVFSFGIIIIVIMVIVGAIGYATAAGNDDKIKSSKKTVIFGLIGAAIIGLAWLLVNSIIPNFLGVGTTGGTGGINVGGIRIPL